MKNRVLIKFAAILFLNSILFLSISGCKKDLFQDATSYKSNVIPRSGDLEENFNFQAYDIPIGTPMSVEKRREALAYALSSEMFHSPAFREALYASFAQNEVRYREVVLGVFKNITIDHGTTVSKTVAEILNERLKELSVFSNSSDPLAQILTEDKLVSVWFPNYLIYTLRDSLFDDCLPVIYGNLMFIGGHFSELEGDANKIVGLRISSAPVYRLYDPLSKRYYPEDISFKDVHGYLPDECQAVAQHLHSLPYYNLAPGYKLVHIIDDIQSVYASECNTSLNFPLSAELSGYSCPRAEYELKIIGDYSKNANIFYGFDLSSPAVFDHLMSHPCNNWYKNGTMAFRFTWLPAVDGEPLDYAYNHLVHCYSTDLVKTTYSIEITFITLPSPFNIFPVRIPIIRNLVSKETSTYYFPDGPRVVFSNDERKNHWKLEKNADGVFFDAKMVHFGICTANNQQTTTHSFQIGGKFDFKIPEVLPSGSVSFEDKYSRQKVVNYQITAGDVYDLGNARFEYCHPYVPGSGNRFLQWISTGSVILRFRSPWYN